MLSTCHVTRLSDAGAGMGFRGDLRYCINKVNDLPGPDAIDFRVTGTINLTGVLPDLSTDVTINGPGPNRLSVRRDTGGDYRIFKVSSATVGISGLTITNGYVISGGGGILNLGGIVTINNAVIADNFAKLGGGGIEQSGPKLTITNSTIKGNSAGDLDGGAIQNYDDLTVSNCTISGNAAFSSGGGIANRAKLFLSNSTISNNSVVNGIGGGIYHDGTVLTIHNSTIAGNTASMGGGGIYLTLAAAAEVHNTVIAQNTGFNPDVFGNLGSTGFNLIGNGSGGSGYHTTDLLDVDPLLGPLADNGGPTLTHALLAGSPAIDAGDNTDAPEWDQRGPRFPRIVNGTIDIGAFEFQ